MKFKNFNIQIMIYYLSAFDLAMWKYRSDRILYRYDVLNGYAGADFAFI